MKEETTRTAEEILFDELNDNQIAVIETYPCMKDWVLQAMEIYAAQFKPL